MSSGPRPPLTGLPTLLPTMGGRGQPTPGLEATMAWSRAVPSDASSVPESKCLLSIYLLNEQRSRGTLATRPDGSTLEHNLH